MTRLRIALAFGLTLAATAATAAEQRETSGADPRAGVWGLDPQATSAELARGGWKYLGMATLSWPDGRQAVVTMWNSKLGDFARCFDYFDAAMHQTGGKCERSGTGL
jgi:pectin methylesterase-like acyl-CoA thioesterase